MKFQVTQDNLENFVADDAGEIALLFCDISYFDDIIKECEDQVVEVLDDTFRAFDSICTKVGIQKIEVSFFEIDRWKNLHGMWRSQIC